MPCIHLLQSTWVCTRQGVGQRSTGNIQRWKGERLRSLITFAEVESTAYQSHSHNEWPSIQCSTVGLCERVLCCVPLLDTPATNHQHPLPLHTYPAYLQLCTVCGIAQFVWLRMCYNHAQLLTNYTHATSSSCMSSGQCSHSHAHTEGATHGELNRDAYVCYNVFTTPSNVVRLCIYASSRDHTQLFNDVNIQIWRLKY